MSQPANHIFQPTLLHKVSKNVSVSASEGLGLGPKIKRLGLVSGFNASFTSLLCYHVKTITAELLLF